jgi:hypothetical protein
MIVIPLVYIFIAVFVFVVLQEIIGFWAALLTGLLWLPALIIGIIANKIQRFRWIKQFLYEIIQYPGETHNDSIDAILWHAKFERATKFWLFWLAIGICYELYAIITDKVDTLSERVWAWLGKHWIFRVAFIGFWVWAFIHIVFGPCAFGIC